MTRVRYGFIGVVAAILSAAALPTAAAARTVVDAHGQLRVSGHRLVDKAGRPVTLRGMSLFWSQWMPQYYTAQTVGTLTTDWKIDVIRAAIGVDGGTDRPVGGILQNYAAERDRAYAVIDAAIAQGIYVIVDWHAHGPYPDQAIRFFREVATKYGKRPNIIYETWNEPLPRYTWARDIKPYHQRVIAAIRAIDRDALVVAGTGSWSQDVDIAADDPLTDGNVAYTIHYYAGEPAHQASLLARARAASRRVALFATEYGFVNASGDGPINAVWSQAWWDFLNAAGISHLNWSITDKVEGSAALKPGARAAGGFDARERTTSGDKMYRYLRGWRAGRT